MLRSAAPRFGIRGSRLLLSNGPTFNVQAWCTTDDAPCPSAFPVNEKNVRSSSMFPEPNTSVYDSALLPWTYFAPHKVNIQKMPAPDAKYYQKNTKRPWDVSTTEWREFVVRRSLFFVLYTSTMCFLFYFVIPKEKNFSGLRGSDGFYVLLPKNKPEMF